VIVNVFYVIHLNAMNLFANIMLNLCLFLYSLKKIERIDNMIKEIRESLPLI